MDPDADVLKNFTSDPQGKRRRNQVAIFLLTFFTYAALHFSRESWSILKSKVESEQGISSSTLGVVDTLFLLFYSIGLFISGQLGDHYSPKMLIVVSYFAVSVIMLFVSKCN